MTKMLTYLVAFLLSFSISSASQTHTGSSTTHPTSTSSPPTAPSNPRLDGPDTIPHFLRVSGRVVSSDGSPLEDRAAIQSNCKGTVKTETYTDAKGNFSFDFSDTRSQALGSTPESNDSSSVSLSSREITRNDPRDSRDCELTAVLASFTSQTVSLIQGNSSFGHLDVGHIVVHRIAISGSTVSAKPVPESARKEYFKGLEEKGKGKLDSAGQRFRKAVDDYPSYAAAWLELGRVQNAQKDPASARQSFQHAIAADSSLLPAYQELAQNEARDSDWSSLAATTDQMLKLDAQNHPEFWFYNCVSKYHLGDLDAAQKSALEGVKVDSAHRVPKMEYVLGIILLQTGDNSSAAEHLHKYLSLNPNGQEARDAEKKLQDIEKK